MSVYSIDVKMKLALWWRRSNMKHVFYLLLPVLLSSLFACTKSGDVIYIDDDQEVDNRPIVYFIYKEGSLGDLGYVDALWRGIAKATTKGNMLLSLTELPSDTSKVDFALTSFLEYMRNKGKNRKSLIVVANDNLEQMLHHYEATLTESSNVSVLLAETKDTTLSINTIRLPGYGVYYQAGRVVAKCLTDVNQILIANANPDESNIADMRKAFQQGVEDGKDDAKRDLEVDNYFISETSGGYDEAEKLYQMSYDFDEKYQLVLPICGGTIHGFLRYNREHPASFYTIGVDADFQHYSNRVPFSIVKHIDNAVADWITRWAKGEVMEKHMDLGLSTGYTELVISDSYSPTIGSAAADLLQIAIVKEEEYEKAN